jgi:hypothetical protein
MRVSRLVLIAACLVLLGSVSTGCYLNEIDKSMAQYKGHPPPKPEPAAPAAAPPTKTANAKPAGPIGMDWWKTARTLGQKPSDGTIGRCQLGGHDEFMRRDDCLARGGQPD